MQWFNNQVEERRRAEQQLLEDSFARISGVVLGKRIAEKINDQRIVAQNAIDEILKFYHCKPAPLPENIRDAGEQLDFSLRPHGMMRRDIVLEKGWYRNAYGPILAFTKEGGIPVALLPGVTGYRFTDPQTGRQTKVNRKTAGVFDPEAVCFYAPLPRKKLNIVDLLRYMWRCVSAGDLVWLAVATLAVTGVGLLMPRITRLLTGPVLSSGQASALIGIAISVICISLSSQLIGSMRDMIQARLTVKTSLGVESSMMMRLLSLPTEFFRRYSPGELKSRAMSVNQLCSLLLGMLLGAGLTSLSSLLYVTQIFSFAPALVVPSLVIVLITIGFSILSTMMRIRIGRRQMEYSAKESGMSYGIISGIQKIKLAGAEKRVFARWLNLFADEASMQYNPPTFLRINSVITTGISLVSNIVLYNLAVRTGTSVSDYYAFTSAYGMLTGAFMGLMGVALQAAQIRPILEMAEPFLKTVPETAEGKEIVTDLSGRIELDHVSFRYDESSPYVLRDLSLQIDDGEYVAVVGRTGCGKSTLVRLLLGFEKPEKGAVFYDSRDITGLDLPSLRRKIGTVTQDAGLFQGSIYSNIVITAPELSEEAAWEAAETAGIADDIRAMPMGMHTVISEGQGGISGGQRQRLMIARAIAPKPKILIFDEATSALDNKTQRQVSEALDKMGCTRLVIAHRLSTIRHCDRILVLEDGRIAEDGTYEELIAKGGLFAELVERQRTDASVQP